MADMSHGEAHNNHTDNTSVCLSIQISASSVMFLTVYWISGRIVGQAGEYLSCITCRPESPNLIHPLCSSNSNHSHNFVPFCKIPV